MPKVFIIILNFNGWTDTEECLASLAKIDYDNFEIILIDNGSNDNCQPSTAIYQQKIQFIQNKENLGFAAGNNQGIKLALSPPAGGGEADYVLLLNNDTVVEPDFLTKLVEAGEKNKEFGILGPVIYDYENKNKIQFAGGKINWSRTKGEHLTHNPSQPPKTELSSGLTLRGGENHQTRIAVPPLKVRGGEGELSPTGYITGCCLLIKCDVIEKIGPLSEDYFLYYEDTDWNMRARQAGYRCGVVPSAKIYHKGSASATEFSYPYIYYHTRNGLIFGLRFGFAPLIYFLSVWIFLKQLIKLAIGYKRDWAKPVIRGVIDFWRGKRGKLEGFY